LPRLRHHHHRRQQADELIHDRTPVIIDPAEWDTWLNPDIDLPDALQSLVVLASADDLQAYPISIGIKKVSL
jgi:putative SOS response-associated peptidase YedK